MTTLAERAAAAAGRPDTTTAPVTEEHELPEITEQARPSTRWPTTSRGTTTRT